MDEQTNGHNPSTSIWYESTWFSILMLFILPPVGIILIWKYNKFGFIVRTVLSIFFGLMFLGMVSSDNKETQKPAEKTSQETTATTASTSSTGNSNKQPTEKPPTKTTTDVKVADEVPGSLGMTPEKFRQEFNRAAKELEFPYSINKINIQNGSAQDVFQYMFTDHLGLTASVNKKDGTVRDMLVMGQGDGSLQSGVDIILAMGVLIETTNPNLSPTERGNILKDLGIIGDNVDVSDLDGKTIRNGIKYTVTSSPQLGIMLSASDANDN